MISILLTLVSFAAADPPRLAGVPTSALPGLGLGEPDLLVDSDAWQAPLAGGWARHFWSADAATAARDFAFQRLAASQAPLPPLAVAGADEAVGGGTLVVARRQNVVVVVRGADAPARAAAILAAELPDAATSPPPAVTTDVAGVGRDQFGRRVR